MNREMEDYSTNFEVNARPKDVYKAIIMEVDKWWTTSSNTVEKVGDKLTVRFGDAAFKVIVVSKMVPNELICWQVEEANINHEDISKKR